MTDIPVFVFKANPLRLHGKVPRVDIEEVSYPIRVRDGMLARIKVMPFFVGFNFSSSKSKVILTESIPFCGVYLLQEFMAADGDANAGEPRFKTTVRYGVSVIVQNNDTVAAEYQLDKAMQYLSVRLFTDPTFYNNSYFKIQGFTGGKREHVFGHIGSDQQTPIAELRWELMCDLGVIDYPPVIPDMLETIHEQTNFGDDITDDPGKVQQVTVVYDMDQDFLTEPVIVSSSPGLLPAKASVALSSTAPVVTQDTVIVTDNFNRANGVLGANWLDIALGGYSGHLQIASNQVACSVASMHQMSSWNGNTFAFDQWCEVSFPVVGSYASPAVRCDPFSGSGYTCFIYPSGGGVNYWFFAWVTGGVDGFYGPFQLSAVPLLATDVVRLEVSGPSNAAVLTLKLNGAVIVTITDTAHPMPTVGSPGIHIYDTIARIDNFNAGPVTGGPPPALPHGLYLADSSFILLPTSTLQIERTQPWSCLSVITILNRDVANGSVLFTNVKNSPFTGWEAWIAPSGVVRIKIMHEFFASATYIEVDGTTLVADGNQHMVAASYDGSSTAAGVKIYVDGVLETMTINMDTLNATIITGAGDMFIGNQYPGSGWGINGVMNFFAFSNVVRDAAYMSAHGSLATKPSVDANNILYYDFSEGSGTTLIDQSASGYNGTISGAGYLWT